MRCLSNSDVASHTAKRADVASDEYAARVASPVMDAIDHMPKAYREMVNEYGYVDIYRAWKRGITPAQIKQRAVDGAFHLS